MRTYSWIAWITPKNSFLKKLTALKEKKVTLVEAIVDLQARGYFKLGILLELTNLTRSVYY